MQPEETASEAEGEADPDAKDDLPASNSGKRRSGYEALDIIFRPYTQAAEGALHLWLGNTRMGKTFANNILVTELLKRKHVDTVFTVDEKDPEKPQYGGTFRANVKHLYAHPLLPHEDKTHVNFRGCSYRSDVRDIVDHGELAGMIWSLKRTVPKSRLCLNIDELADATNGYQNWKSDENAQIYRKGAGIRISTTATTQLPQNLPREAYGLSQTIGLFRLDAREMDYLVSKRTITPDIVPLMATLERGDFVLYVRGEGLLPHVFRF